MKKQPQLTRRGLAKGLASSSIALTRLPHLLGQTQPPTATTHTTSWQQIHPGVWRATIGHPEPYTPVSSRLVPPQLDAFSRLPSVSSIPFPPVSGSVTSRGATVELPLQPGESIYGLGLQFLSFDQRGSKKVVRVNADPKMDTGDSHAPVPFYVTTSGIGILIDTARYATFYLGDQHPKPATVSAPINSTLPSYTPGPPQPESERVVVEVPRTTGVDIYLFAGPTMLDAVRRYNVFSGGGHVPPEWGLGFWYRTESAATQQTALSFIQTFRDHKIPCDVLGLEPGWQTHAYSCTFAWEKARFPDPAAFVKSAAAQHCKINLWEHAFTHPTSPLFATLQPYSGDYGVWGGLVPDFAGPQARQRFGDYHGTTFLDIGISGFKLDECDNSDFTGGWSFPELSRFPSGIDGEQMHNVFGLRYQSTIWQQFRKRNQPTYNLVRSSGALAAPYPFVLYSDLYDHRQFIRALATSGFSGLLWCPEVRDAASLEDLIRRLQSVMFSPLAMVNGWYIKNPPWMQLNAKLNNQGQLAEGWQQIEDRCREIINWRMNLVPYLTAAFQRYAHDGTPPFRALILDFPTDKTLRNVDDQFLVGDRMMVAPLFANEPSRKVHIPAGPAWHDLWTGARVEGGATLTVDASTPNIPVYIKSGSILPWADAGPHAASPESRRLTARIYGDGSLSFELQTGTQTLKLTWTNNQGTATTPKSPSSYQVYNWKQIG